MSTFFVKIKHSTLNPLKLVKKFMKIIHQNVNTKKVQIISVKYFDTQKNFPCCIDQLAWRLL